MHVKFNANAQLDSKQVLFDGFVHERFAFLSNKGENGQKVQTHKDLFNMHINSRLNNLLASCLQNLTRYVSLASLWRHYCKLFSHKELSTKSDT